MTVYIDRLTHYPNKPFGYDYWCHLWADSDDELHDFAAGLGMQRRWFQTHHADFHHYDLTRTKHVRAVQRGAVLTDLGAWLLERKKETA